MYRNSIFIISIFLLTACTAIDPGSGVKEVSQLLTARGGAPLSQSVVSSKKIRSGGVYLKQLDRPFSLDTALRTALVHSPALHAEYARLEISRTDVKQASLPRNPKFDGVITAGVTGDPSRLAAGALYPILDLIYRPIRVKESKAEHRATQVSVAEQIISHVNETSNAYVQLAKTQARSKALSNIVSFSRSQLKTVRGLNTTGSIDGSQVARLENVLAQAQIELAEETAARQIARTQLASLMGISSKQKLNAALKINALTKKTYSLSKALQKAESQRLELAIAKQEIHIKETALERAGRKFGPEAIEVGVELEREEGETFIGPSIGVELPIFDNGDVKLQKAKAELKLAKQQASAIKNQISSEVRTTHADLAAKKSTALAHKNKLVPFARAQAELAKRRFEGGQIEALDFLEAEMGVTRSKLSAIDASAQYWEALSRFNIAVGGWPRL